MAGKSQNAQPLDRRLRHPVPRNGRKNLSSTVTAIKDAKVSTAPEAFPWGKLQNVPPLSVKRFTGFQHNSMCGLISVDFQDI